MARRALRGEELFAEGDAADDVFTLVSGCIRLVRLMSDGRRQICAFIMVGDNTASIGGSANPIAITSDVVGKTAPGWENSSVASDANRSTASPA